MKSASLGFKNVDSGGKFLYFHFILCKIEKCMKNEANLVNFGLKRCEKVLILAKCPHNSSYERMVLMHMST